LRAIAYDASELAEEVPKEGGDERIDEFVLILPAGVGVRRDAEDDGRAIDAEDSDEKR
jgi:hypothetical protein